MRQLRSLRICAPAFALLVAIAATASADPPGRLEQPPGRPGARAPTARPIASAYEKEIRDSMEVATDRPLDGVAALGGFHLRFSNGDHKIRRVGVLANGGTATLSMSDQDKNDPFAGGASWVIIESGRRGQVSGTGGGQFELKLPADRPAGHKLVLTGFEFRRKDGTDANVRSIGVWLDGSRNTARVMLMDDQGPDFRGFEKTLGMALAGNIATMGDPGTQVGTLMDAIRRINGGETAGKYRPYAVTVQYAWIPEGLVTAVQTVTGTGDGPSSGASISGEAVIQGFELMFVSSDHHLLDIGVMGPTYRSSSAIPHAAGQSIAFQDNNKDDPKRWAVTYALLRRR